MRKYLGYGAVLVLVLGSVGCRNQVAATEESSGEQPLPEHLGDKVEVSLEEWLRLPRAELAQLATGWTETAEHLRKNAQENPASLILLPQQPIAQTPLVFARAAFSAELGFSVPPYLGKGGDAAVAVHLARLGDQEAARKLADARDRKLLAQLERQAGARSYPLEWTRLVSLVLETAQWKLACGDATGATELVQYHRQLQSILDRKTAAGPLGASVLGVGRQALQQAAQAWRDPKWDRASLAEDVEAALKEWGPVPVPEPALMPGAAAREVAGVFAHAGAARSFVAATPDRLLRVIDLLELDVPVEGIAAAAAFLDSSERLGDLVLAYRPRINEVFRDPERMAARLTENGARAEKLGQGPGLLRQVFTQKGRVYEISLLTRGCTAGAFVRIRPEKQEGFVLFTRNPRDFGAFHLDRSFSQNRQGLVPEREGDILAIRQKELLARIVLPGATPLPELVELKREPTEDLVQSLILSWPASLEHEALPQLLVPLWQVYGNGRLETGQDSNGELLYMTWQDDTTRARLRLPFEPHPPELIVEDARGSEGLARRLARAAEVDQRERAARLQARQLRERLPRTLDINNHQIEDISLGMTRDVVEQRIPVSDSLRVSKVSDGINLVLSNDPPQTATFWARQVFLRFGPDKRLAEMRVRYQMGPARPSPSAPSLMDLLLKAAGAPEKLPAPWLRLWSDLPGRQHAVLCRWQDDRTQLTYQRDAGGGEVIYRSFEDPGAAPLPPLEFCSRGPELCTLGDRRADVLKRWKLKQALTVEGADMLPMPADSRYDLLLVWYEKDTVARIVARLRNPAVLQPDAVRGALQEAWAALFDQVGYLRRHDVPRGMSLDGYGFHDDRTRVRIFGQHMEGGPRLFTEWRTWPVPAPAPTPASPTAANPAPGNPGPAGQAEVKGG